MTPVFEDEHLSIWRFGRISCAYWIGECSERQCEEVIKEVRWVKEGGAYLSIIGEIASPPSTEYRKRMMAASAARGDFTSGIWVLATGFRGSFVRSVVTAMHNISRTRLTMKVFSSGEEATAFCAKHASENATEIFEQVKRMLAHIDEKYPRQIPS